MGPGLPLTTTSGLLDTSVCAKHSMDLTEAASIHCDKIVFMLAMPAKWVEANGFGCAMFSCAVKDYDRDCQYVQEIFSEERCRAPAVSVQEHRQRPADAG